MEMDGAVVSPQFRLVDVDVEPTQLVRVRRCRRGGRSICTGFNDSVWRVWFANYSIRYMHKKSEEKRSFLFR